MSTFLLTSIIAVSAIIIIKLLIENNKLKSSLFNNDDQLVDENKTQSVRHNQLKTFQDNLLNNTKDNGKTTSKNAFLHGADNFGKIERGVVLDGMTYTFDNERGNGFEIQPAPKKRRNKK
jgi:hypothetical protein